jgi:hypothetical protein
MPNMRKKSIHEVVEAICKMDLDPIKFKLMNAEEGYGWSREYADRMETEYKRFLVLSTKYPEESISPSKEVDKFWHGHILDTLKYAEDCDNVFGYFVHHFPYVGLRGKEDAANREASVVTTQRLYREEFGDAQLGSGTSASYCGIASATTQAAADQHSYCGIASATTQTAADQHSYCGIAGARTQTAADRHSYCGIASARTQTAADQHSYCGIAGARTQTAADQLSYCGIADRILNATSRPTLPRVEMT